MIIISIVNTYAALCVRHIYVFLVALGLRCYARAFSSCIVRGQFFVGVRGLFTSVAFLVVGHRL